MLESTPLGIHNIAQNYYISNLIIVITNYLLFTSIYLIRIIHAICTYQLKVWVCIRKSFKVITHPYICNKFTSNETSPQTAQSLSWASISSQSETWNWEGVSSTAQWGEKKKIKEWYTCKNKRKHTFLQIAKRVWIRKKTMILQ